MILNYIASVLFVGNSVSADVTYSRTHDFGTIYKYNMDYASTGKTQKLVCPKPGQSPLILFPTPCENNAQCRATNGPDQVCCEKRCVKGVPAPRPTSAPQTHERKYYTLFNTSFVSNFVCMDIMDRKILAPSYQLCGYIIMFSITDNIADFYIPIEACFLMVG